MTLCSRESQILVDAIFEISGLKEKVFKLQNLSFNALPLFQNHKFGPLKFSLLFEFKGIFCKALACEKDPGIPKVSGSL